MARPRFSPTAAQRRCVEELSSTGMSTASIAAALRIARPTLVEHFRVEIEDGRARKRAELIELLFRAARRGRVGAMLRLLRMIPANPAPANPERFNNER